eukprot:3177406-Amphidinium_carterae.1
MFESWLSCFNFFGGFWGFGVLICNFVRTNVAAIISVSFSNEYPLFQRGLPKDCPEKLRDVERSILPLCQLSP